MQTPNYNRRDFHRLAIAAMGGVAAGSLAGCQPGSQEGGATEAPASGSDEVSLLLQEPHVCRGLNACKGQGASKENDCAGQGTCASVVAHSCHANNECKGQGGCGTNPGENACKGKGGCGVPLMDHAWGTARKNYEAAMTKAGKTFGAAPAAM